MMAMRCITGLTRIGMSYGYRSQVTCDARAFPRQIMSYGVRLYSTATHRQRNFYEARGHCHKITSLMMSLLGLGAIGYSADLFSYGQSIRKATQQESVNSKKPEFHFLDLLIASFAPYCFHEGDIEIILDRWQTLVCQIHTEEGRLRQEGKIKESLDWSILFKQAQENPRAVLVSPCLPVIDAQGRITVPSCSKRR